MYLPAAHAWSDLESVIACCRAHPFATVVSIGADGPEAQHLPLLIDRSDDRLVVHGHVAIGNPLWQAERGLAIFHGPHAYVSAAWYDERNTVPTWNYLAVHVAGPLTVITDPAAVRQLFGRLAASTSDPGNDAWQAQLDEATFARLAQQIRWFRIEGVELIAKAKLSANHSAQRRQRVIEHLAASDDPQARSIGAAMARTLAGEQPWPAP